MPKRDYAKKGMPNYCRLKGMPNYNMPKRDKKGLCQKGIMPNLSMPNYRTAGAAMPTAPYSDT